MTAHPLFQSSAPSLHPGCCVGNYRILREVSHGEVSTVYMVEHTQLSRRAALKVLHRPSLPTDLRAIRGYLHDTRRTSQLAHAGIVQVIDVGVLSDLRPYVIMEWVEGSNFQQLVRAYGPLSPVEVLPLIAQLTETLGAAHNAGITHGYLRPTNVLIYQTTGRTARVKLIDFGVSRFSDLADKRFLSPEQRRGELGSAAIDVFGLGVLLTYLLTGGATLPSTNTLAPRIAAIIEQCLWSSLDRRFASVKAVRTALQCAVWQARPAFRRLNSVAAK